VAATLLNPQPLELLLYPLEYIRPGNTNVEFIKEWQSPDFHNPLFAPLALAMLSLAAMGIAGGRRYLLLAVVPLFVGLVALSPDFHDLRYAPLAVALALLMANGALGKRRDVFLPLLVLLMAALTLQSLRNQPLFAVVFMLVASQRASELWGWASAAGREARPKPRTALNLILVGVFTALIVMVVAGSPTLQLRSTALLDHGIEYPQAGAEFVRTNYPEARMFNDYDWGGYLINELYPRKVFIDGRSDFYGDALMNDYRTVNRVAAGWDDVLEKHDIEVVLIKEGSLLSEQLGAEADAWVRVFINENEVVFARADIARP
jgi:hypothetical protein